jgi:hypothetical protein
LLFHLPRHADPGGLGPRGAACGVGGVACGVVVVDVMVFTVCVIM